jgi:hypothetical protein
MRVGRNSKAPAMRETWLTFITLYPVGYGGKAVTRAVQGVVDEIQPELLGHEVIVEAIGKAGFTPGQDVVGGHGGHSTRTPVNAPPVNSGAFLSFFTLAGRQS